MRHKPHCARPASRTFVGASQMGHGAIVTFFGTSAAPAPATSAGNVSALPHVMHFALRRALSTTSRRAARNSRLHVAQKKTVGSCARLISPSEAPSGALHLTH